jgi:hypothetical protein
MDITLVHALTTEWTKKQCGFYVFAQQLLSRSLLLATLVDGHFFAVVALNEIN